MLTTETPCQCLFRPRWQKLLVLCCVGFAVFLLPYHVPVTPSVSLSYVVGFNNHAAVLAFVLGTVAFVCFTRGQLAVMDRQDRPLPLWTLFLALAIVLLCALFLACGALHGNGGQEAFYNLNRQQLLAAGLTPYRQFEYPYGPLLLYPATFLARLLHLSQPVAYYAWWIIQWLVGIGFLWAVVHSLDFNIRHRSALFALLALIQGLALPLNGVNYTPFRAYAAAFFVIIPVYLSRRWQNPWLTASAALLCVTLALSISLEQATGTVAGISVYLAVLFHSQRSIRMAVTLGLFLLGAALIFLTAAHGSLFFSARIYASGALCFPLLPTVGNCLILFIYIVAGLLLYRQYQARGSGSVVVPLVIAGFAMLPSALGRCDFGHLLSAVPAMAIGVAAIVAMPSVRRWWVPLFLLVVLAVPSAMQFKNRRFAHRIIALFPSPSARPQTSLAPQLPTPRGVPENARSIPIIPSSAIPCDRTYFTVTVRSSAINLRCLDPGYYLAMQNVATADSLSLLLDEMRRHAAQPLLLYASPLDKQVVLNSDFETNPDELYAHEGAFAVPPPRNPPVTLDPIIDYIQAHYTPGPLVSNGQLRIWYPAPTWTP